MPCSVLGIEDITEHRIDKNTCPVELTFLLLFFFICGILKKASFFPYRFISEEANLHFFDCSSKYAVLQLILIAATCGRPCRLLKCCINFFLENLTTIIIQSGFSC